MRLGAAGGQGRGVVRVDIRAARQGIRWHQGGPMAAILHPGSSSRLRRVGRDGEPGVGGGEFIFPAQLGVVPGSFQDDLRVLLNPLAILPAPLDPAKLKGPPLGSLAERAEFRCPLRSGTVPCAGRMKPIGPTALPQCTPR